MTVPSRLAPVLGLAAGLVLAGCGSKSEGPTVAITATDQSCEVADTSLDAGKTSFEVSNEGDKVTEVYVYGEGDRVVTERENIGPGTKAVFEADLAAGDYEIACKPGQKGDGIRQAVKVTGEGGAAAQVADREVELTGQDYSFAGLEGFSARAGETIEFEMKNTGSVDHEFEVLKPDGDALGEIGPTKVGAEGKVTLTFDAPGTYTYVCGIDDHEERGMKGTFTVS